MVYQIDPGRKEKTANMIDNIVYSREAENLETGKNMELKLSILMPGLPPREYMNPGEEPEGTICEDLPKLPCIVWIPGGGWRGQDKNQMACELGYLVKAGYVVACVQYRTSAQAKFPAQLQDIKTAIRFLRKKGAPYWIDPERIGVMGRSAGGHLAAFTAENLLGFETDEWSGISDRVLCGVDLFGPTDLEYCLELTRKRIADGDPRWKKIEDSHEYALVGSTEKHAIRRASPYCHVNPGMAPLLIMHGTDDPVVSPEISRRFYERVCQDGCGEHTDLVFVEHAGHGTEEFWQEKTQQEILRYLDHWMKPEEIFHNA